MKPRTKVALIFATILLLIALGSGSSKAQENTTCQSFYGGQVCGTSTPEIVDTAGGTDILFTISGALYATGLTSFVLAKNSKDLVPFLR